MKKNISKPLTMKSTSGNSRQAFHYLSDHQGQQTNEGKPGRVRNLEPDLELYNILYVK